MSTEQNGSKAGTPSPERLCSTYIGQRLTLELDLPSGYPITQGSSVSGVVFCIANGGEYVWIRADDGHEYGYVFPHAHWSLSNTGGQPRREENKHE